MKLHNYTPPTYFHLIFMNGKQQSQYRTRIKIEDQFPFTYIFDAALCLSLVFKSATDHNAVFNSNSMGQEQHLKVFLVLS